jgi:hypothetical protein
MAVSREGVLPADKLRVGLEVDVQIQDCCVDGAFLSRIAALGPAADGVPEWVAFDNGVTLDGDWQYGAGWACYARG